MRCFVCLSARRNRSVAFASIILYVTLYENGTMQGSTYIFGLYVHVHSMFASWIDTVKGYTQTNYYYYISVGQKRLCSSMPFSFYSPPSSSATHTIAYRCFPSKIKYCRFQFSTILWKSFKRLLAYSFFSHRALRSLACRHIFAAESSSRCMCFPW